VACNSIRRLAELPCENGPPCSELETSNNLEPSTALGFATFTLLKTLRTPTAATSTPAATARSALALPLVLIAGGCFRFGSDSERLGEAQVQDEVSRASLRVDGDEFSGSRGIERPERRAVDGALG